MTEDNVYLYLKGLQNKKVRLIECRKFNQNSDIWILDEHKHDDIELIYFIDGEGQVKTSIGNANLTFYDVLIHPEGVLHKEFIDLHLRQEVINLVIRCEEKLPFQLMESFILNDDTGMIRTVFRMIEYHAANKDEYSEAIIENYLHILLLYLLKSKKDNPGQENDIIGRMMEFVQDNYMNDIRVEDIAMATHVSESYLSRVMKKHMCTSPMKYVHSIRIEAAKRYLKTELSIEDVAANTGYQEVKYFSTIFKKVTGMTPSSYRNHMKERAKDDSKSDTEKMTKLAGMEQKKV